MTNLIVSPDRDAAFRSRAHDAYRSVDAFGTVAWRAPEPRRFDALPANEWHDTVSAPLVGTETWEGMPRWLGVAVGCVVAAVLGALLGGALSL